MKALATYILRGRMSAIMVTAGMGLLALLLMPLSWPLSYLSGASVVLVTLVQGPKEGLVNIAGATVFVGLVTGVAMGQPMVAAGYAIFQWLPIWLLAVVLYQQRSLALVLMAIGLLGVVLVGMTYLFMDDPASWWYSYFTEQVIPVMKSAGLELPQEADLLQQLEIVASLMTGILVVSSLFGYVMSLFIGRWWQSVQYRPGAFGEEFRQFRLGKVISLLVIVIAVMGLLGSPQVSEVSFNLLMTGVLLFMFQGLAVAHSLNQAKSRKIWLIMVYVVMIMMFPYGVLVMALLGLADNGIDIRHRFAKP